MLVGVFVYFHIACFYFFSVYFFSKKKKKKKIGGEDEDFFFIAFQILHVFLPDISVHCTLIKYAYI
jgi:hypothetical protein